MVRYSRVINNLDSLVITKLDVLDSLEEIKICTGYRYKGQLLDSFPPEIRVLEPVRSRVRHRSRLEAAHRGNLPV